MQGLTSVDAELKGKTFMHSLVAEWQDTIVEKVLTLAGRQLPVETGVLHSVPFGVYAAACLFLRHHKNREVAAALGGCHV